MLRLRRRAPAPRGKRAGDVLAVAGVLAGMRHGAVARGDRGSGRVLVVAPARPDRDPRSSPSRVRRPRRPPRRPRRRRRAPFSSALRSRRCGRSPRRVFRLAGLVLILDRALRLRAAMPPPARPAPARRVRRASPSGPPAATAAAAAAAPRPRPFLAFLTASRSSDARRVLLSSAASSSSSASIASGSSSSAIGWTESGWTEMRTGSRRSGGLAALDGEVRAVGQRLVGHHGDGHAEALLEFREVGALLVEDVERDLGPRPDREVVGRALEELLLERAQHMQRHGGGGADVAGALADAGRCSWSIRGRRCGCAGATSRAGRNARCGRPGCAPGRSSAPPSCAARRRGCCASPPCR